MVSSLGLRPAAHGTACTTSNRIAKLAQLQLQLSACQEQLGALEQGGASAEGKARVKQQLTAKIETIKAQIADLSRCDAAPACAAEEEEARQRSSGRHAGRVVFDTVRLALLKEGHLGTLANLRA